MMKMIIVIIYNNNDNNIILITNNNNNNNYDTNYENKSYCNKINNIIITITTITAI